MAGENPSVTEIVRLLPYRLQLRFGNLSRLVAAIIDETHARLNSHARVDRESVEMIQLAALIFSLDHFFRAGTRAARESAETFERFKLTGFRVGTTEFTKNNAATRRGERIANDLRAVVRRTRLRRRIQAAHSMQELIESLVRDVLNGETLD
jgi:hypothetical protein